MHDILSLFLWQIESFFACISTFHSTFSFSIDININISFVFPTPTITANLPYYILHHYMHAQSLLKMYILCVQAAKWGMYTEVKISIWCSAPTKRKCFFNSGCSYCFWRHVPHWKPNVWIVKMTIYTTIVDQYKTPELGRKFIMCSFATMDFIAPLQVVASYYYAHFPSSAWQCSWAQWSRKKQRRKKKRNKIREQLHDDDDDDGQQSSLNND